MVFEVLVFEDPKVEHQDKQRVSIKKKKTKKQKNREKRETVMQHFKQKLSL